MEYQIYLLDISYFKVGNEYFEHNHVKVTSKNPKLESNDQETVDLIRGHGIPLERRVANQKKKNKKKPTNWINLSS